MRIGRVFDAVETATGITRDMITSRTRIRDVYFARMIVAYELRRAGFSCEVISNILGMTHPTSVTYQVKGYENERSAYFRKCAKQVEELLSL